MLKLQSVVTLIFSMVYYNMLQDYVKTAKRVAKAEGRHRVSWTAFFCHKMSEFPSISQGTDLSGIHRFVYRFLKRAK